MAVTIGSARSDERGKINSGKAGDQTGREVSTQNWYKHSKGWRVLRCTNIEMRRYISQAMKNACSNSHIGYDQYQRNTLYNAVKGSNFDVTKLTKNVETDCSALVRVCVQYALVKVHKASTVIADFVTSNEASVLLKTGLFKEMTGSKYTNQSDYLCEGDILVTKTKGHTVVVLTDGPKAEDTSSEKFRTLGDRILKNGMEGSDVKELQSYLIQLGYDCGKWGADGDFGDATEIAVMEFQVDNDCEPDGEYGPISHAAMKKALVALEVEAKNPSKVMIEGGNCFVRTGPSTNYDDFFVVRNGSVYPYAGETSENGWNKIKLSTEEEGWVSGKYSKLLDE